MLIWMTWVPWASARFRSFISSVTLGFCTISTSGFWSTSAVSACCIADGLLLGSRTTYFMPRHSAPLIGERGAERDGQIGDGLALQGLVVGGPKFARGLGAAVLLRRR